MRIFIVAAVACAIAKPAFSQAGTDATKDAMKPSVATVPATPERTTASFGDWVLRCETVTPNMPRICEVAQAITVQTQTTPVAQVAFGRIARSDAMRITALLPTNVLLGSKPKMLSEKDDKSPIDLTWDRCVPGGCIASAAVADSTMNRLPRLTEPGSIIFKDAAEQTIVLRMSFRGLSQAIAAFGKEP